MWGIVASFERRADGDAELTEVWSRAVGRLTVRRGVPAPLARAVVANALAVIHFGELSDLELLDRLVREFGGRQVAELQDEGLRVVDGPDRPLTTALAQALGHHAWGLEPAPAGGVDLTARPDLVTACAEAGIWLMCVGAADPEPPVLTTVEDVLAVFRDGGVPAWRALVAASRAEPWSGVSEEHLKLLDPVAHAAEVSCLRAVSEMIRRIVEDEERAAIAAHIRNAIAETGLTQREFASLVGTSSSRLSTYVTGTVTPSAAMLLRINRAARRVRRGDTAD
ncbi:helix-turn-helix domain-containing protein [Nocardioides nitrophenolicus]|uniref:helix-turn-helix domain-containing protein n=1 Tax=Nocardioides nitrophenolicus TaxID=60489 RepID=UPI00195D79A1|nr:helix-turn-helix transcriptional regulator [Nocardioides nitrophenolicus]MBM7520321.1 DNA-binding transcriptional regulator YiaG [Nocardioides nitrophenolicus]